MHAVSTRAAALPADQRRAAIIAAALPLLLERGANVSTRQIAEAAGIAEGTIFRVFPDKFALIHEAVKASLDPALVSKALSEIYPLAPIDVQITEAARIIVDYFERVIALFTAVRNMPTKDSHRVPGPPPYVAEANAVINESLTELFERHRENLRIEPARAASAFRALIFANCHPGMGIGEKLTIDEIVSVLLFGFAASTSEQLT
jgi:AcrR family transcriptional regulator